jgi:serralysin
MLGALAFPTGVGLAATATVSSNSNEVLYVASPGESNAVVLTADGLTVRISDPGATISAGAGCVLDGADALCQVDVAFWDVFVDLGDGDDSANLSSAATAIGWAGAGDDQIVGAEFESTLQGGPGNDRLTGSPKGGFQDLYGDEGDDELLLVGGGGASGGPGNDTIRGGFGRDLLWGEAGDDIVDGRGGFDTLIAWGSNLRLTPTALFGDGSDTLSNIEYAWLRGSFGRNVVINARAWRGGTEILAFGGDDLIVGGFGRDTVLAGAGNDLVAGRAGRDRLWGEGGADVLLSRDFERDRVHGGPGRDRARVDRLDTTRLIEVFFF